MPDNLDDKIPDAADNLDDKIPDADWEKFDRVRDLPLYLWDHFREEFVGEKAELSPHQHRLRFTLIDEEIELDPRLVARLYRGYWARVFFPSETGTTLRNFVTTETEDWPRRIERGKLGRLPEHCPAHVNVLDFTERYNKQSGRHLGFERLPLLFTGGIFETKLFLKCIDPKAMDPLIEFGDVPAFHTSLIAAMIFTCIRKPKKYPGMPDLLDDVFLPDFNDDLRTEREPNVPRMHFARRTHHRDTQGR